MGRGRPAAESEAHADTMYAKLVRGLQDSDRDSAKHPRGIAGVTLRMFEGVSGLAASTFMAGEISAQMQSVVDTEVVNLGYIITAYEAIADGEPLPRGGTTATQFQRTLGQQMAMIRIANARIRNVIDSWAVGQLIETPGLTSVDCNERMEKQFGKIPSEGFTYATSNPHARDTRYWHVKALAKLFREHDVDHKVVRKSDRGRDSGGGGS